MLKLESILTYLKGNVAIDSFILKPVRKSFLRVRKDPVWIWWTYDDVYTRSEKHCR